MKGSINVSAAIFVVVAILTGVAAQASAQTYTIFEADPNHGVYPNATHPTKIDAFGRVVGVAQIVGSSQTTLGFVRSVDGSIVVIQVPGATDTSDVTFVGPNGVTGFYGDSAFLVHGFVGPVGGPYASFNVPGAHSTFTAAANASGQIIGTWTDSNANFHFHGFVRAANGAIKVVDPVGAVDTELLAINASGQIVGISSDSASKAHGFLRAANGSITLLNAPGAAITEPMAINDSGQIAGITFDASGRLAGFIHSATGAYTTFVLPGPQLFVKDIGPTGAIVGSYGTKLGRQGFLRRPDGTIVTLAFPGGARFTSADSVNQASVIVGDCQVCGPNSGAHGFLLTGVQ